MTKAKVVEALMELSVPELIERCRNYFDPELATKVCQMRIIPYADQIEGMDMMSSFLALFRNDSTRQEFLAFYIPELHEKICAKAKCGCVYSAEEGYPCKHDWQLVLSVTPNAQYNSGPYAGNRCLTDLELERHAAGGFSDIELSEADDHMDGCEKCWGRLEKVLTDESIRRGTGNPFRH